MAYSTSGKFKEALECENRSIAIAEELFGKRSTLRSYGLKNMGAVYNRMQGFGAALRCFEESSEIRRELFGDTHPETVSVVVDCAFTLCRVNRIHRGHELIDEWFRKISTDHLQYTWLKDQRRNLQQQFPRPGFRQPPRAR